ncbi:hypothetical protein LUZ60_003556 [Juncus effusus]|nr:hypothetical protein LUZ60_003556 [Juncus effusus]
MTPRASKPSAIESVAHQLYAWRPFESKPYFFSTKKPCRSDRSTAPTEDLDLSRLSLRDLREETGLASGRAREDVLSVHETYKKWFARKRRRRTSRSVSGRSSDISTTRVTLMSPATGSDSSNEHLSWASDISEVKLKPLPLKHQEVNRGGEGNGGEGEGFFGEGKEGEGKEGEGYGSEPGYRGDGEFGYDGDEFDDEDEFDSSGRFLFWADRRIADVNQRRIEGGNIVAEQKSHHRCRRKKHDWRVMAS